MGMFSIWGSPFPYGAYRTGHFFMEWKADPTKPIKLNGAFFTFCAILRFVIASAAEAELGALFLNCKQATIFRLTLKEMGHPQPPTQHEVLRMNQEGLVISQDGWIGFVVG